MKRFLDTDIRDFLTEPSSILIRDPKDSRVRDIVIRDPSICSEHCVYLVGYPWDWSTAGVPGARFSPSYIRKYLYSLNISYTNKLCICDLGDIKIAPGDQEISERRFEHVLSRVVETRKKFVVLGGDHSLTKVSMRVVSERYSKPCLLVFDAHLDLRELSEGRSSGSYLRELLESVEKEIRVMIVGYREHSNPEYMYEYARRRNMILINIEEIKRSLSEVVNKIIDNSKDCYLYISVDADSIDSSQCPAVNSISPDGMFVREIVYILDKLGEYSRKTYFNIVGGDIVEVVADRDINEICGRNIAYITYKMIRALALV
ncbi:MAG: arginase family protein [Sulfolobales archaeon]